MAPVDLGLSPSIQDANSVVARARRGMETRLNNSQKVVIASQYLEKNVPFFEKHGNDILQLINDTRSLSAAINTLNDTGYEAGPCKITKKGRFWDSQIKKPVEEVNENVQNNLDQEVVKTALSTLRISEEPKEPLFTLPALPSNGTLVKGGAAVAITAIGSAVYFRDKIAAATPQRVIDVFTTVHSYVPPVPQGVKNAFSTAYSYIPGVPQGVKNAFSTAYSKVPSIPSTKDVTNFFSTQWSTVANSQAGVFVANHKTAFGVGIGVIVTLGAVYAIYRAVQNRKSEEA
jgi:hypothetical protein